ncbi:MAG: hypothetical protein V1769_03225 [Thermoplasmatota archaeon]
MRSRKTMKILMIGAAVIYLATIAVCADGTTDETPGSDETSLTEDIRIVPTSYDILEHEESSEERTGGDEEDEFEEMLILPATDSYENLISPGPDTEGSEFNLYHTSIGASSQKTSFSSNNLFTFPPLMIGIFGIILGFLFIFGKRTNK